MNDGYSPALLRPVLPMPQHRAKPRTSRAATPTLATILHHKQNQRLKRRTREIKQDHMLRVRESFSRKIPLLQKLCEQEFLEEPAENLAYKEDVSKLLDAGFEDHRNASRARSHRTFRKLKKSPERLWPNSKSNVSLAYGSPKSVRRSPPKKSGGGKAGLRISSNKQRMKFGVRSKSISIEPEYRAEAE